MTSEDIRRLFFKYFVEKGHTIVPSSSLVPADDPTLLFTNAGMVQFKKVFTGEEKRSYTRAVSIQKCLRAGGKHNDLENVGFTARHHTFFEMLGNFSFGDYFKKEAIEMGWEFLTRILNLPPEKLWVSVYMEDNEAYEIWRSMDVPEDRIVRLGKEDNFWQMGDTGPCGPCSEIIIDQGPEVGCGRPECSVGCDCDRYLELWNLVFMEFERKETGELLPLPRPSIDTGMGLERITAVVEGVKSNYDTDLFLPIINAISHDTGIEYVSHSYDTQVVALRVIADHVRAITFLISDGVLPSNEGRGYVLRRIIRRGARYGRLIGLHRPFLYKYIDLVIERMEAHYPEIKENRDLITTVTHREEEGFINTLEHGMKILEDLIGDLLNRGEKYIPGEELFRLYDTYGFPVDLTAEIAREKGLALDEKGFHRAMEEQRERARRAGLGEKKVKPIYKELGLSQPAFVGYETMETTGHVIAIIKDNTSVTGAYRGEEIEVIFDPTPFYGESGGQIGDRGVAIGPKGTLNIVDTQKPLGLIVHKARVVDGEIRVGEEWILKVNRNMRKATARSHTATHMLHAALRSVVGSHVKQSGSLVEPDRLRFDFSHFKPLSREEIKMIEALVNEKILENLSLITHVMDLQEAMESGALALFDEKYGEKVRVVEIPGFSKELCGGTHCKATGDIGSIKIIDEGGVAAGIRRIEALTGKRAMEYIDKEEEILEDIGKILKTPAEEFPERLERLVSILKEQEKELIQLKQELNSYRVQDILSHITHVDNISIVATKVDVATMEELRHLGDLLKTRLKSGVIALGANIGGKASLLVMVTKDLTPEIDAREVINAIAIEVEGRGGGRVDMAQAGGKKIEGLTRAIKKVPEVIQKK